MRSITFDKEKKRLGRDERASNACKGLMVGPGVIASAGPRRDR